MRQIIIAFTGKKYSGKDTAGKGLLRTPGWTHESFAAPIRAAACALMGITLVELQRIKEIPQEILGGKRLRDFMQLMGTEFGREMIDYDMWLNALKYRISDAKKVVITDLRFPNEAKCVHDLGGIIVEVQRPGQKSYDTHASEQDLARELIDEILVNDRTTSDLQERAYGIYRRFVQETKCTNGS